MSLEESIALVEKFQKDLAQLESDKRQMKDNDVERRKPIQVNVRRRSMFRYFWPWIIFAATELCLLLMLSLIVLASGKTTLGFVMNIGSYVFAALLIVLGIIISRKKAKEDNAAYEIAVEMASQRRSDLLHKNYELESEINSLEIQLAGNPEYQKIPADKRKSSSMARAKLLLQSGKAINFYDALNKL